MSSQERLQVLASPLPLAAEVVERSEAGGGALRFPLPNPPPHAGEGAHRMRGEIT